MLDQLPQYDKGKKKTFFLLRKLKTDLLVLIYVLIKILIMQAIMFG